ncbi:MAG: type II 3-dehydroquinate dehydratase [Bacillota bacterium]
MRIWVLHGPNLGELGKREPTVYGTTGLEEIDRRLRERGHELGVEVWCAQYDGEGELVSAIHRAGREAQALVINPGAYAHYSLAIADAIRAITIPCVEVHLSNVWAREPFRHTLVTAPACRGVIAGLGVHGYLLALEAAAALATGA